MALLFELVSLALKPLLLAKLYCQIGARSFFIVVQTWLEVMIFALNLHIIILWRLAIFAVAVLCFPIRAFTALYRERLLEMKLRRLKNEFENVLWDKKDLEDKLHVADKERKMMKTMLIELEEEHDEAIVKIETLEEEVRELKNEIQRLKEIQGKALWSYKDLSKSSYKPDYINKNVKQLSKDPHKDEIHGPVNTGSKFYGPSQPYFNYSISSEGEILAEHRDVAISRSLFSAMLSLVVGIVVWEAKNPCMPLFAALFTVVTMSLTSVLRLFMRIEHKPASDVVALLSFNWFVLGTLSYPMLPRIARFFAPLTLSLVERMF
ncbi:hypothetical protein PHJA_002765300 [Phtheirospermum japonicum]|uniref:Uncharacterized protein n=1 Tax=Phtheirospermum japonicum TaxID=374723 RepID=A0A830D6F6_9LAMI|nr:hypothetical protein PHJA_002765300 [Phtheirospermum japonicum]